MGRMGEKNERGKGTPPSVRNKFLVTALVCSLYHWWVFVCLSDRTVLSRLTVTNTPRYLVSIKWISGLPIRRIRGRLPLTRTQILTAAIQVRYIHLRSHCGVTRVVVTRGGNWRCHPIFLKKSWPSFFSVIALWKVMTCF